jgi:hypothetical protein
VEGDARLLAVLAVVRRDHDDVLVVEAPIASRHQSGTHGRARRLEGTLAVSAYAVLGFLLIFTRLAWLGRSFWYDEILTARDYVRAGPRAILIGPYIPNNHELYSLLGWLTVNISGESEMALRLLAAVPFLVGVAVVTAWLDDRVDRLTALLFLVFTTASPMLFDLSREARGYGLAFLAMSVLVVTGLELRREGRGWLLWAFFISGLVGTWTLPIFGIAFASTGAVLLSLPRLRRKVLVGLIASLVSTLLWYAPHVDDLLANGPTDGTQIAWFKLPIAPVDSVLIPGILWFDDTFLTAYPGRLLVIAALAILLASSPLLRDRTVLPILVVGAASTLVVVWATRLYLQPRFVSYLLVPLFVLLANGVACVLRRARTRVGLSQLLAMSCLAVVVAAGIGTATKLLRLPPEAWKESAAAISTVAGPTTPVYSYALHEDGLEYYLDHEVRPLSHDDVRTSVCGSREPLIYVTEPFGVEPVDLPCLSRATLHRHFDQYSRGGQIDVWLVPPRPLKAAASKTST